MSELDHEAVKQRQRAIWSAGDYRTIGGLLAPVGEVVARTAAIEPGMKVLDVAAGSGNVAIPAAQAGADVTGLDLTPALLEIASERAQAAGVTVEWVEGDAEALPFEDESFDRVLSTFGVMFAPRHDVAAAELVRTCRPGGTIVLANWTPDGFVGRRLARFASRMPAPPPPAPPTLWGEETHLRALLGGQTLLAVERCTVDLVAGSMEAMMADFERQFGPMVLAHQVLEERLYEALKAELIALVESFDTGEGEVRIPSEYLLVVGLKP